MEVLFPARLKVLLLVLMFQALISAAEMPSPSSGCRLSSNIRMNYFSDGDLIVGGILQIHDVFLHFHWDTQCTLISFRHYRHLLVLIYTIEEVNKDPEILPNVTLGYRIYDSCASGMKSFASAFGILSGTEQPIPNYSCWNNRKVVGFIGDLSSESSLSIAWLTGIYRYPQISYGSADPIFNNRLEFPSFYRMIPNELSEIDAIMSLIGHFGWKWVGLVVSDDDIGHRASERLQNQMNKDGGCLAFLIRLKNWSDINRSKVNSTEIYRSIEQTIYKTTANVIILFVSPQYIDSFNLFFALYKMPKKIWIVSSSFSRVIELRHSQILVTFNGTFALSFQQGEIPGFKQFFYSVNPYKYQRHEFFTEIWEIFINCTFSETDISLRKCTGNETFDDTVLESYGTFNYRIAYGVYTAVYTMAHTLHELYGTMSRSPKSAESLHMYFQQWQLNALMRHVAFRTSSGDQIFFRDNGDPPANYDILKWYFFGEENLQSIKVGSFDTSRSDGDQLFINNSANLWGPYFSEECPPPLLSSLVHNPKWCHPWPPHDHASTASHVVAVGTTILNSAPEKTGVPVDDPDRDPLLFAQSRCSEPCKPGFRKAKVEGAPSCCYTCVLCADGEMSNITDAQSCTKCSKYEKSNSGRTSCIPRDINYLSYDEHLGSTLSSISVTFSISCAVILGIFIKYRETPIVRANNRYLSCLLLISLMLCFLCTLLFIGRPTQICCLLRQVTFGIVFTISVSSVLAKTLTVIIVFNATKPGSKLKKYVGTQLAIILVIVCSLGEIVISIVWLVSNPPFPEADTLSDPDYIILLCNEGSGFFFCIIGYIGTLALLSFIAAFLAKDFPDRFNEAKNITFSMLGFCSVWGAFVPAYLSSKGSRMVAVEIFAILSSSAGLLACIFIPKCYIIFLWPELNTRVTVIRTY
uniref:G-protein coupled receptors family 3 profile domain-containing protein n=1 Tax=Xenopus tropicalis TaxID=8364 RepID=A0A1B8Y7X0_XENTR